MAPDPVGDLKRAEGYRRADRSAALSVGKVYEQVAEKFRKSRKIGILM
jgi:hypothetical protein